MSNRRTIHLISYAARCRAADLIARAPEGYVCTVGEETRSQEQNRLMWPLIQAIQRQVSAMAPYSAEDIKLRFMHALGVEMRFLPELEGPGMFPVGQRSSTLTKEQFSGLLDLLHKYGAEHGVSFEQAR